MMTWSRRLGTILAVLAAISVAPAAAATVGSPRLAAVQVALRAKHLYHGTVDGLTGPETQRAIAAFRKRSGLGLDAVAGAELGSRLLGPGATGGDVVELQFLLAWHGFPNGTVDGGFGPHVELALVKFQRWAHVPTTGLAGPETVAALHAPVPTCPVPLAWPVQAVVGDRFGPRGAGFHPGIDLPAAPGTPVHAAAVGTVTFAGPTSGGYGNLVVVKGAAGVATMYAHLSRILARPGEQVTVGTLLGLVGATGETTGPHLHFEVRVRGAAVDPLPALR
jgi:peptidoglycan hydrolase-like protein with peptidoglycan-binding domain